MIVVPNTGKIASLASLLVANTYTLHLYQNNYTPVRGTLLANLTEATFTGYAAVALAGWTVVAIDGSNYAYSIANTVFFTAGVIGVGNTIFGAYITDGPGNLIAAELFATGSVNMNVQGNTFGYQTLLQLGSIYSN